MDLRHVAGFALVGWYLMVPPIHWSVSGPASIARHSTTMNPSDPLSKWVIVASFDIASKCEHDKVSFWRRSKADLDSVDPDKRAWAEAASEARCVASEDPRLKEK
jgi:hypothetical protein